MAGTFVVLKQPVRVGDQTRYGVVEVRVADGKMDIPYHEVRFRSRKDAERAAAKYTAQGGWRAWYRMRRTGQQ